MKTDAIVIGAELDSLLAAARLAERGHTVQLLSSGVGGLHYAPAGIHVLGFGSSVGDAGIVNPLVAISELDANHPYKKVGRDVLAQALSWFSNIGERIGLPAIWLDKNSHAITPAGLSVPVAGVTPYLATHEACKDMSVAVINFTGVRDFPFELIMAEFEISGVTAHAVEALPPGQLTENVALAKSFDRLSDPERYFAALKPLIPVSVGVVLFPAVMGLKNHLSICATAEKALGRRCLEIPTLPASVPGIRLEVALRQFLQSQMVEIIANIEIVNAESSPDGVKIMDAFGRSYTAQVAVIATGGVLMGGLEVLSYGSVREKLFDLKVWQSKPLSATSVEQTLDALHQTGVETNSDLNPLNADGIVSKNLFVTGQSLSHCNPAAEASADGISIATGWAAAQGAGDYIESMRHG